MSAVGLDVSPERITDLLVLVAVFVLEMGPGLCLTLAMALSAQPVTRQTPLDASDAERTPVSAACTLPTNAAVRPVSVQVSAERPIVVRPSSVADWLAEKGGRAQTSMRRLALEIGRSPSGVHDEIGRLVASGAISAVFGPRGTLLTVRAN